MSVEQIDTAGCVFIVSHDEPDEVIHDTARIAIANYKPGDHPAGIWIGNWVPAGEATDYVTPAPAT